MLGPSLPSRLSTDQRPRKSHVLVDDARAPPFMELPFLSGWFCTPYTRGALGRYTVRRLPKNKGNLRGLLSDLLPRSFIWESKSYDYKPYMQRQVKTATSQEQWAAWRCPGPSSILLELGVTHLNACAEPELMVCKLFGHSVSCIPPQSREVTDGWDHTASRAFCRPSSVGCLSRFSSVCLQSMGRHIYIKCAEGSSITSRPTNNISTLLTQSSRN